MYHRFIDLDNAAGLSANAFSYCAYPKSTSSHTAADHVMHLANYLCQACLHEDAGSRQNMAKCQHKWTCPPEFPSKTMGFVVSSVTTVSGTGGVRRITSYDRNAHEKPYGLSPKMEGLSAPSTLGCPAYHRGAAWQAAVFRVNF